jgi:hypothetical protein
MQETTVSPRPCASDSGAMLGRNLRRHSLSADELISFWADDLIAIP